MSMKIEQVRRIGYFFRDLDVFNLTESFFVEFETEIFRVGIPNVELRIIKCGEKNFENEHFYESNFTLMGEELDQRSFYAECRIRVPN